jgi:hypothetical protein
VDCCRFWRFTPDLGDPLRPFHQVAVERLHEGAPTEGAVRATFGQILPDPLVETRPAQKVAAPTVDRDALERPDLVVADRAQVAWLDGTSPC